MRIKYNHISQRVTGKSVQNMIDLTNSYTSELDEHFYERRAPEQVSSPELLLFNEDLASFLQLNLTSTDTDTLARLFSGTELPASITPIAMAYAGHQFGNFVPQLGDGRAVMLGEATGQDGLSYDLQLKGSGQTRFSRAGDGKSALGPVIREYIVSEAMYHLGVPTSRALAAVATGEHLLRQGPEPGGVFTRVARGHIRIGSFEYFAARQQLDDVRQLAEYAMRRFYPDTLEEDLPVLAFFRAIAGRIMTLVAQWQGLGFIHGVMNTDNMNIAGETIDFGPCAFMDTYQANKVFSSIDHRGRYAYNQQPMIAQWNLSILASCLVPLVHDDENKAIEMLQAVMSELPQVFEEAWLAVFRPKLGLFNTEPGDRELIESILTEYEDNQVDFTQGFRQLSTQQNSAHRERLARQAQSIEEAITLMNQHNPWIIPRNHQVERAIREAYDGQYEHFRRLVEAYKAPYQERSEYQDLTEAPLASEVVRQTFCGT